MDSPMPTAPPVRNDVLRQMRTFSADDFVSHYVLERTPWLFESQTQYVSWRGQLALGLGVDPLAVAVVGSACLGRSLSPSKGLASFHSKSDIDVAVVSEYYFDEAWRWLRNLGPLDRLTPKSVERDMLQWHRRNLIFDGTIATDQLLGKLPFGPSWSAELARAGSRPPARGRLVNVRIYRNFESVRSYQVGGVRKALDAALAMEVDDLALPLREIFESEDGEDPQWPASQTRLHPSGS